MCPAKNIFGKSRKYSFDVAIPAGGKVTSNSNTEKDLCMPETGNTHAFVQISCA
jgi:hypothetical protein